METVNLSRHNPLPLYYQLKEVLRAKIYEGELQTGETLPSVSELMNAYGVSRHVANRALADLENEGVVVTRKGVGTFVSSARLTKQLAILASFTGRLKSLSDDAHVRVLKMELREAEPPVQEALGLQPRAQVVVVERVGVVNGLPLAMLSAQYPVIVGNFLLSLDIADQSIYSLLAREHGIKASRAETALSVTFATIQQSSVLDVKVGFPLMYCRSTTLDQNGSPFEFSEEFYRSDRVEFTITSFKDLPAG